MHDLAIIIVSTNEARWLTPCLSSVFAHAGAIEVDAVVADNESTDGTRDLVERAFPSARVVTCENRGFAHANNRGALTTDARYLLFLNPDTEILEGTFEELVNALDSRPSVGLAGVKQVDAERRLAPTIRYFPNALRATSRKSILILELQPLSRLAGRIVGWELPPRPRHWIWILFRYFKSDMTWSSQSHLPKVTCLRLFSDCSPMDVFASPLHNYQDMTCL